MQITTGLRRVLSSPQVYSLFQNLMGARQGWVKIVNRYINPMQGQAILDIGCGPADVLDYLPNMDYWGFDISEQYISQAQEKFGSRGEFKAKLLTKDDLADMPKFDIVLMSGVLHHLEDSVAFDIVAIAFEALKKGGRLVTIDPCFTDKQNPIARYLISKDRGQSVRNAQGYLGLVQRVFESTNLEVVHKTWIPYTHCYMVCTK